MAQDLDLAKTQTLLELSNPALERNESWREQFYAAAPRASLAAPMPQVLQGPDGFPYFRLAIPKPGVQFESFSITHVLEHCTNGGMGAVIVPSLGDPRNPLWAFTYGDLCSLRQFGDFFGDPVDRGARPAGKPGVQEEVVDKGRQMLVGAPSEDYLPSYARIIIGKYLNAVGVPRQPGVKLVHDPQRGSPELMFNFGFEDFPDRARLNTIMGRLSWFFPRGRTLLLRVDSLASGDWTALA